LFLVSSGYQIQKQQIMPHVTGQQRNQMMMFSLDSSVAAGSFVRVIDAFVDATNLESFGFAHATSKDEGRPSFHPSVLLKLYLYGYHNGIRSSRKLEREAHLNLEAMWLTSCQCPRYKTIADFRKNHGGAFRQVFRSFVRLLRDWELADGQTIAIDSFKIRAQNSLKNNMNQNKIDRHLEYIDNKIAEYEARLDECDNEEDKQELEQKKAQQESRKSGYKAIEQQLKESGQEQISLTDPDARSVVLHRNIVNVGYNIQAASDSKHKLLVEFETGDVNDSHALAQMATATKEILKAESMDALADKGYHTGGELKKCEAENITAYVSPKAPATPDNGLYPVTTFTYNPEDDTYTCPAGETLRTNNVWYKHSGKGKTEAYRFLRYTTPACKTCANRSQCTAGEKNGRAIDRSEYAPAIEANRERVTANPEYYRLRQQITEHQFGTLKRQRGFTFTLMKGKTKVLGEVGLEFIGYNLVRCVTILGLPELCKALKKCYLTVFCHLFWLISGFLKPSDFKTPDKINFSSNKLLPA
jgi:transposase